MSYGLNIEMHKQVDNLISLFSLSASADSCLVLFLWLPPFALPLLRQGFDIFGACALVDMSLCVHRRISSFVRACMCAYAGVFICDQWGSVSISPVRAGCLSPQAG